MQRIRLGRRRKFALVDDEDFPALAARSWSLSPQGYAQRRVPAAEWRSGMPRVVLMHREVMGFPDRLVDHINGDPLDNRRSNLRACNHSQNGANRRAQSHGETGVVGVSPVRYLRTTRYRAHIRVAGRRINIGDYDTIQEATAARLKAEGEHFGGFASTRTVRVARIGDAL